jgi:hypothetical protein
MTFTLLQKTTKTDSTKGTPEVEEIEEAVANVRNFGGGIFLVAVYRSFADSGLDTSAGTVTTSTRHYITCVELGIQRREVFVSYKGVHDGLQIYCLSL